MMPTPPKGLPTLIWLSSSIEEIPLPIKLSLMFDNKGNSFLANQVSCKQTISWSSHKLCNSP